MCIFCEIIKGNIPTNKIYEDEKTLVFLDISCDHYGHTLVVPKKHVTNILDCDEETLTSVIKTVKKVSEHYVNDCGFDGVNVLNANNECAGQSVFHLHFHIMPRKIDDGIDMWPRLNKSQMNLSEIADKLKIKK